MASHTTFLTLINTTPFNVTVSVSDTDNYDWDNQSRPDKNFNGLVLSSGSSLTRQEDLNAHARSAMGTMRLALSNGQSCSFRFNQYDAYDGISPTPRATLCQGADALSVVQRVDRGKATNTYTVYLDY